MPHLSSLKFPYKLWKIVNECKSGAISWGNTGKFILINYKLFKREYLNSALGFKTAKINSFIRQLNLYGFRKMPVNELQTNYRNIHAYHNENFVCGNQNLLNFVSRKPSGVKRQKKKHSQKNSPQNKLLITCRKAFSTALRNSANSKIVTSRRRLQFPDEKPAMGKDIFPLPIEDFNEQFRTDDRHGLSEYDLLFQNDCSLFSDIKDHIPFALPQEISLDNKYILQNGPVIWNEYSNNNSEDCISGELENFSNEKNNQEIDQSIDQNDEVSINETAPGSLETENEENYESPILYSLSFNSEFAYNNSHLEFLNVDDHLAFASSTAKVIVEPVQNSNFILNQNFAGGLGDHLLYQKNSPAESVFERHQPFNNGDFGEF